MPLLVNAKSADVIDEAIRLLVNLTIPVECLLSVEVMSRTEIGRHTIYELNNLLVSAKEAFSDSHATKAVVDRMKSILETEAKLTVVQCEKINNCLLLLRNMLHVCEGNFTAGTSVQNRIIWNLFTQAIDKLVLHLINCSQGAYWTVILIQFIALLYKDQHVGTLQKLLNVWFEASLSESSEDNESNCSPLKPCSGDSSPMLTSDPTSDSSDTDDTQSPANNLCPVYDFSSFPGSGKRKSTSNTSDEKQISSIELQNSLIRVMPLGKQPPQRSISDATDESLDQHNLSSSGFGSIDEHSLSGSDQKHIKVIPFVV